MNSYDGSRGTQGRLATISDVARLAGVSVSVVSYVLNNTRPVKAEKRKRVQQAIATLDYVPSEMARGLRKTESRLIGAVLPDLMRPAYGAIARNIEEVAREADFLTIFCNAGYDDALSAKYVHGLHAARVAGMIIRPTRRGRHLVPAALESRTPSVVLMYDPACAGYSIDSVMLNNGLGTEMAVQHLVQLGHRRIGLVSSFDLGRPTMVRLQGFLTGMTNAGLPANMAHVRTGESRVEEGASMVADILDTPDPPTALIVAHERQSVGALHVLRSRGVRIPEDLSVVVWGTPDTFALSPVEMTMIVEPFHDVGRLAAKLLLKRIASEQPLGGEAEQIVLQPSLRVAGSTAGPREGSLRSPATPEDSLLDPEVAPTAP